MKHLHVYIGEKKISYYSFHKQIFQTSLLRNIMKNTRPADIPANYSFQMQKNQISSVSNMFLSEAIFFDKFYLPF